MLPKKSNLFKFVFVCENAALWPVLPSNSNERWPWAHHKCHMRNTLYGKRHNGNTKLRKLPSSITEALKAERWKLHLFSAYIFAMFFGAIELLVLGQCEVRVGKTVYKWSLFASKESYTSGEDRKCTATVLKQTVNSSWIDLQYHINPRWNCEHHPLCEQFASFRHSLRNTAEKRVSRKGGFSFGILKPRSY